MSSRAAIAGLLVAALSTAGSTDARASAVLRPCEDALARGLLDEAVDRCEAALKVERATDTLVALARARLRRNKSDDVRIAEALTREATAQSPLTASAYLAQCDVAVVTGNPHALRDCATRLEALAPNQPETWAFVALHAYRNEDLARGDAAKARAESLGARPDLLTRVRGAEATCRAAQPPPSPWTIGGIALGVGAALFVVLSSLGTRLSETTLRALAAGRAPEDAVRWRDLYRAIVGVTAALFWVLLPLVSATMLGLAGLALYEAFQPRTIRPHPGLYLGVAAGALFSFFATLRAMFVAVDPRPWGVPLELDEHPRLRALLTEVAERVGTRGPDEVLLVVETTIGVTEIGGRLAHLRGRARRLLVVGAGVLGALTRRDLGVLLAHELGHYKHADTAGHLALGVRAAHADLVDGLQASHVATWYNPAWWFVVAYGRLFARLSLGASRLQEILADRVAVGAYGSSAFAAALRRWLAGAVAFDLRLAAEATAAATAHRPLADVFRGAGAAPDDLEVDRIVADELARETTELDTHPAPKARLAAAEALAIASPDGEGGPAWDLLDHGERLATALLEEARQSLLDRGLELPRGRRR